ncbi:LamG domain-containing protein, partial [Candidatus Pacearchaeota archaeon]|nr:LamG domain-containing protein [Candidatus Pacearchaeota archaeon]
VIDSVFPQINFTEPPTSPNATRTASNIIEINVSITESYLNEVKLNWNSTNFSVFNDSVVLMMNFDNVSLLGENDTYVYDVSGNGNNGTVTNAVVNTTDCKFGNCYSFDGVGDFIDYTNTFGNFSNTTSFTVSAWIYDVEGTTEEFDRHIVGKGDGNGWNLYFDDVGHNRWVFQLVSPGGSVRRTLDDNNPENKWMHLVGVFDAIEYEITLYVNGVNGSAIGGPNGNFQNTRNFRIGRHGTGNNYWNGTIDEVMIWNRSLSASEIQQLYFMNLNKYDTDKWALYVNQSWNSTNGLNDGNYSYFASVKDDSGNENVTENRSVFIDSTAPSITNVTYENESGILNGTVLQGENLTINATVTGAAYVWAVIWKGAIGTSEIFWQGFLNLISGNMWSVTLITNLSYPHGMVNFTIYSNDSTGNIVNFSSNFTSIGGIIITPTDTTTSEYSIIGSVNTSLVNNTLYYDNQMINFTHSSYGKRLQVYGLFYSNAVNFTNLKIIADSYRTVVNISGVTGISSNHSIFIPLMFEEGTYVCPNANILNDVNKSCIERINFTYDECNTGTWISGIYCKIDEGLYRIDNLTGTGGAGDSLNPRMNYVNPTEINSFYTTNTSFIVNVSIDEGGLDSVIYNFNNTNYTLFNDNLVLFYNFDNVSLLGENDTYVVDLSGNSHNATGLSFDNDEIVSGKYGNAIDFDPNNDYLNISFSSTIESITTELTVSLWIKPKNTINSGSTDDRTVIDYGNSGSSGNWLIFFDDADSGKLRLPGTYGGNVQTIRNNWTGETWYHIAFVYDDLNNITNYVDGIYDNSGTGDTIEGANYLFTIGKNNDGNPGNNFTGMVDELMIFNRSLGADEIQQLYFTNLRKYDTDKWALYVNQSNISSNGLGGGNYSFDVYAIDIAGNFNQSGERSILIDLIDPVTTFVSPTPSAGVNTSSLIINVSSNDTFGNISTFIEVDRSLLLWMRMDDINGSGDPTDLSSYSNNGTAMDQAEQNISGYFGKGFNFDGSGDTINISNYSYLEFDASKNYTWSAWIYPRSADFAILSKNGSLKGYSIYMKSSNLCISDNVPPATESCTTKTIGLNTWTHIAVNYSAKTFTLFINGSISKTDTISGFVDDLTTSVLIGLVSNLDFGTKYADGIMDEILIFNRTLSGDEILALYANVSTRFLSIDKSGLDEGNHSFKAYTQDRGGNYNYTVELNFTLDKTLPIITNLTYENESIILNGTVERGDNFTINATVDGAAYVWVKIWEGAVGFSTIIWEGFLNLISGNMWSVTIFTNGTFPNGTINYTLFANDSAGNLINFTSNITITNIGYITDCSLLNVSNHIYEIQNNITA